MEQASGLMCVPSSPLVTLPRVRPTWSNLRHVAKVQTRVEQSEQASGLMCESSSPLVTLPRFRPVWSNLSKLRVMCEPSSVSHVAKGQTRVEQSEQASGLMCEPSSPLVTLPRVRPAWSNLSMCEASSPLVTLPRFRPAWSNLR
eukprot:g82461.t1